MSFVVTPSSQMVAITFNEVRCPHCAKLICKWEPSGVANLQIKCSRCGSINVIRLSTM